MELEAMTSGKCRDHDATPHHAHDGLTAVGPSHKQSGLSQAPASDPISAGSTPPDVAVGNDPSLRKFFISRLAEEAQVISFVSSIGIAFTLNAAVTVSDLQAKRIFSYATIAFLVALVASCNIVFTIPKFETTLDGDRVELNSALLGLVAYLNICKFAALAALSAAFFIIGFALRISVDVRTGNAFLIACGILFFIVSQANFFVQIYAWRLLSERP